MKKMLLALAIVASFGFMSTSANTAQAGWRVIRRPVIAPVRRVVAAPFVHRRVIYRRPIVAAPVVYPIVPTTGVYFGVGF